MHEADEPESSPCTVVLLAASLRLQDYCPHSAHYGRASSLVSLHVIIPD